MKISLTAVRVIEVVAMVLIVIPTVLSLVFLWCFSKKPIVAMCQPRLMSVLCFGTLMCVAGFLFYILPTLSDAASRFTIKMQVSCNLYVWLVYIGHVSVLAVLACKLFRVSKVMKIRRKQKSLPWHILGPFLLALLVAIGILIANQKMYPFVYKTWENAGYCDWAYNRGAVAFFYIRLGYCYALILTILFFAWKLRGVNQEIGESRRIFSLLCFLAIADGSVLAANIIIDQTNGLGLVEKWRLHHVVLVLWHVTFSLSTIGILIGPRMYYVWYERVNGRLPEGVQMYGTGQVHVGAWASAKRPATREVDKGDDAAPAASAANA